MRLMKAVLFAVVLGVGGTAVGGEPQATPSAEGLRRLAIMETAEAHRADVAQCASEQRKREPGVRGKVLMRWSLQPDGRTKDVSCVSETLCSTYFVGCVTGLIQGWTFSEKAQGAPIDFPFTF